MNKHKLLLSYIELVLSERNLTAKDYLMLKYVIDFTETQMNFNKKRFGIFSKH